MIKTQKTVWDDPGYVSQWNTTYGLDMKGALSRTDILFPLFAERAGGFDKKTLIDFGCGNGNLIKVFQQENFARWVGIENGAAVLASARDSIRDERVEFHKMDLCQAAAMPSLSADIVTSFFVLEELPPEGLKTFFTAMRSVLGPEGRAILFSNHPAYALMHDWQALNAGQPNKKFPGHRGYFDREATCFSLGIMNEQNGYDIRPVYHHKTVADILNAAADNSLSLHYMLEIPESVKHYKGMASYTPVRGDYPRFLYMEFRGA